jgi:hypothetical protein
MLRDNIAIIGVVIVGLFLLVFISLYNQSDYKQNSITMGLTETVRSSAIANADNSSRLKEGELFISKEDFEKDFKEKIKKNKNIKGDTSYRFEYLNSDTGALKAIRVFLDNDGTTYQATYKVNISES